MWEPALNEAKVYPEDQICRRCLTCEWLEMTHKVRSQNDRPLRGCVGEVWPSDQLFQHSSCLPFFFPPNIPAFLCLVTRNTTDCSCHVNRTWLIQKALVRASSLPELSRLCVTASPTTDCQQSSGCFLIDLKRDILHTSGSGSVSFVFQSSWQFSDIPLTSLLT